MEMTAGTSIKDASLCFKSAAFNRFQRRRIRSRQSVTLFSRLAAQEIYSRWSPHHQNTCRLQVAGGGCSRSGGRARQPAALHVVLRTPYSCKDCMLLPESLPSREDIPFHSLCEHHLLPFSGTAHIAYFPDGRHCNMPQLNLISMT